MFTNHYTKFINAFNGEIELDKPKLLYDFFKIDITTNNHETFKMLFEKRKTVWDLEFYDWIVSLNGSEAGSEASIYTYHVNSEESYKRIIGISIGNELIGIKNNKLNYSSLELFNKMPTCGINIWDQCPICYVNIPNVITSCKHQFCFDCIDKLYKNNNFKCPYCKSYYSLYRL
jgi:hypothetical protein